MKGVPKAGFTFPTTCLANGTVQFTDTSKIPVGSVGSPTYTWNFGEPSSGLNNSSSIQNPPHSYSSSGPFNVKLVVNANGCSDSTTVPVTVRIQPQLSYPPLSSVCGNVPAFAINTATVTNGVTGTGIYSGSGITNGAAGTFNPSLAGIGTHTIKYIFTSALNCIDSVQTTITVKAVPKAGFTFPTSCLPDGTVQFGDTSKPVITPNTKTHQWTFGDGSPVNVSQSPSHLYAGAGPYPVKQVVTYNGCSDSTTVSVAVRVQPQLAYGPFNTVCANIVPFSVATGIVTNNVNGGVRRYKGVGITDSINGIFSPSVAGAGTHTIKFYYRSLLGCSDSVAATITVKPVPVASFTYPDSCLTSNLVQFGSVPIIGASYSWNFGDPSSGGNNVSTLANPSHSYNTFGSYSVKLTVLLNGCSDDSTVNAIFRLQPVINFPQLASICQINDTINVAKAVVTNGVPAAYPGKYSGSGVFDTTGKFNPLIAGYGTHIITYKFTSSSGCIATKTSTITVWPRPVITKMIFNNTPDSNICIDKPLVVSSQVTIPSGSVTKWDWNFGDKFDTLLIKNDSLIHSYDTAQLYRITLATTSNLGCVSDTATKLIYVRSLPEVAFVSPTGICMPNGSVKFQNQTTIPFEDSTKLTYLWNFGDGTPNSILSNPVHVYNTTLAQTDVILIAKSAFGCKAADTATILFYPKPLADFTALPDPVCQGKAVTFTNTTTSANIAAATWYFGDGSNPSTATSPSVIYSGIGEFQPSLIVTSTNGCKDTSVQKVRVYLQPVVDAGKSFVVDAGTTIIFQGHVNAPNLALSWSPAAGLSNAGITTPSLKALSNQTYTLTAIGQGGCKDSDSMTVNILLALKIPNAFSPNGDGKNDVWDLTNLKDYPSSSVEVFNRYGQSVYLSNGRYTKAWDGTFKGNKLPEGTYYYIIDIKNSTKPVAGYVAIIR